MDISLHDNWIYSHFVDHDERMIVLHTLYPHSDPIEFTDVTFEDVLVHHFETQCMADASPERARYPSNVIFDIEEEEARITIGRYRDFILSKRNYGWPVSGWNDLEDLARLLTKDGNRCFHIHGTVGLDGFVIARRMLIEARRSRWIKPAEQNHCS
jgi:hypothetical protein